jgi:hypothetical protein
MADLSDHKVEQYQKTSPGITAEGAKIFYSRLYYEFIRII